jgi:quinoprotein dehydrogenase-associated probable ABC transporter substrate-binding protein
MRLLHSLLIFALVFMTLAVPTHAGPLLRVCADPNNLPFSNRSGEGFENKLAQLIASDLGWHVEYTWWAQRRGFIRNTLNAGLCDVIIGVPAGLEMVAHTRPYYRSTYVLVSRADRHLDIISLSDPRLQDYTIGVHLVGDDGANTPPVHALSAQGYVNNVVGYMIYGNYRQPNPSARLIEDVAAGKIDIAAAWGPLAGYFAQKSRVPLRVSTIADTARFAPQRFEFDITMGVRRKDDALRAKLDRILLRRAAEIHALLDSYGVPLLEPRNTSLVHKLESGD